MNPQEVICEDEEEDEWPYAPSADLPQMITFLIGHDDDHINGIWWSEAMGNLGLGFTSRLSREQLGRMAEWLENWLKNEPGRFTENGVHEVRRMIHDLKRCFAHLARQDYWRSQCETTDIDHLL